MITRAVAVVTADDEPEARGVMPYIPPLTRRSLMSLLQKPVLGVLGRVFFAGSRRRGTAGRSI